MKNGEPKKPKRDLDGKFTAKGPARYLQRRDQQLPDPRGSVEDELAAMEAMQNDPGYVRTSPAERQEEPVRNIDPFPHGLQEPLAAYSSDSSLAHEIARAPGNKTPDDDDRPGHAAYRDRLLQAGKKHAVERHLQHGEDSNGHPSRRR